MNYYGTINGATTYYTDDQFDHNQVWGSASETERLKALKQATRLIDNLSFAGSKANSDQELEFPRGADLTVPTTIIYACYEIAWALLDGRSIEFEQEFINDAVATIGPGRVVKDASFMSEAKAHMIPSDVAWKLLKPYLRDGMAVTLSRVS